MTKTIMWLAVLFVSSTSAHAVTICQSGKTEGGSGHWYWREIDNRKCWYQGTRYLPKNELIWSKAEPRAIPTNRDLDLPEAVIPDPKPAVAEPKPDDTQAKVDQIMADTRLNADQLLAFTCCWPELEEELVPVSVSAPKAHVPDTSPPLFIWSLMPIGFIIGLFTIYRYAKENMS
jgi:hypothetical protein